MGGYLIMASEISSVPQKGAFETLSHEMKNANGLDKVKVFGVAFFSALAGVLTGPASLFTESLCGFNLFERLVTCAYPPPSTTIYPSTNSKDDDVDDYELMPDTPMNEEEIKAQTFIDNAPSEMINLRNGARCSPNLPEMYSQCLLDERQGLSSKFYIADNFVSNIEVSKAKIPDTAELIFIPIPIKGKGFFASIFSSRETHLFSEDHFAGFFIDKTKKKIYYFEPKGFFFHEGLKTKAGITGEGPSVIEIYEELNEMFPGYDLEYNASPMQKTMNTADCVVHLSQRIEDHLTVLGTNEEPTAPRPVTQELRDQMEKKLGEKLEKLQSQES